MAFRWFHFNLKTSEPKSLENADACLPHQEVETFWSMLWNFCATWVNGSWWNLMWSGLVLKRCFGLHFTDELRKPLLLKNLNLWGCILPVEPLLSLMFCTCLLSMFSSIISVVTWPCLSCFCVSNLSHHLLLFCTTRVFCIVRLLILLLLAQAAISVRAGTCVPVLADTVSEISKKFLFPGSTPLRCWVSVCVWCQQRMTDAVIMELWYQIHWVFVGVQGKQREWFPYHFRGQQVEDLVFALLPGVTIVWVLVDWKQTLQKLTSYSGTCSPGQCKMWVWLWVGEVQE